MKPIPMTGEEQKAALGKIRRIPQFVDMFSGEASAKLPKRGRGDHVALRPVGIEKPVVPGMASYAGEGPAGVYCRDCRFFGAVAIQRPDLDTVERSFTACAKAAHLVGRLPQVRTEISICQACRFFEHGAGCPRLIDAAGNEHAPDWYERGIGRWFHLNEGRPAREMQEADL